MIDNKKIEEAARDYINKNGYFIKYDEEPCVDIEFAYKEAAKWAINEFLKDLWHPISEEPREKTTLLIEISLAKLTSRKLYYADTFIGQDWKIKCSVMSISRWLYIDDLIKGIETMTREELQNKLGDAVCKYCKKNILPEHNLGIGCLCEGSYCEEAQDGYAVANNIVLEE